jgi:hypothetical protein
MRPGTRANPGLPWPGRSSHRRRLSVFTVTAVTMQDLELEHPESLPARGNPLLILPAPFGRRRLQLHPGDVWHRRSGGLVKVAVANGSFNHIASVGSGNIG